MSAWADAVKMRGVAEVAAALGLTVRPNGRSVGPCPACKAPRRGSINPRGPVGLTRDGLGWRCHRCQAAGDAVTLAALMCLERVPETGDTAGWREVAAFCERHLGTASPPHRAGNQLPDDAGANAPSQNAAPESKADTVGAFAPADQPPRRPPAAGALWDRCGLVTEDVEVGAWLVGRAFDPAVVADRDLVRALPLAGRLPAWCKLNGVSWTDSSHRVIVPLYGPGGHLESLHARATAPDARPKAASPKGAEVRGLVMADALGRMLLEGVPPPGPGRVIVSEGVPDWLVWATWAGDATESADAALGIIAGSWTPAIAACIPTGWKVIIRTHHDEAGHKYAATIYASLAGRCVCLRSRG